MHTLGWTSCSFLAIQAASASAQLKPAVVSVWCEVVSSSTCTVLLHNGNHPGLKLTTVRAMPLSSHKLLKAVLADLDESTSADSLSLC